MKNKKFNIKKEYKESWRYIKEARYFIYGVIGIFVIFGLLGFFIAVPEYIEIQLLKIIEELLAKTMGMSQSELTGFIFFNNLKSSFFGMIFGVIFGIFPMISIISNGYLLGFVSANATNTAGVSTLLWLLPHGIFELPAIFISLGLGVKLGTFLFYDSWKKRLKDYLLSSLRVFLFVVIPLLIIAAIIEGLLIVLFR